VSSGIEKVAGMVLAFAVTTDGYAAGDQVDWPDSEFFFGDVFR
jgi:hypothetical protein